MFPEFLYHGSPCLIYGAITPFESRSLYLKGKNIKAVHASANCDIAIAAGIVKTIPANFAQSLLPPELKTKGSPPYLTIFLGELRDAAIYLYKVPSAGFRRLKDSEDDWYLEDIVMPYGFEKLNALDYCHLVKYATPLDWTIQTYCAVKRTRNR